MKWEGNRESDNVEDRRGDDDGGGASGGFGGSGIGGGHIGIGSIVIALVASYFLGVNPLTVLGLLSGGSPAPTHVQSQPTGHRPDSANEDRMTKFVRTILADTEDTWGQIFTAGGAKYVNPGLVIYTGATRTGCGAGEAAMGPFYCPADQKVYIDLAFYQTLKNQLGAGGEFAQAYVIAHEVGHHVQNLLGISGKVDAARARASKEQSNALSVRLELQADCFAGVWANRSPNSRQMIEAGDIESAMNAAAKIGDDALQKAATGHVVPESFTHGSSAQRQKWFNTGITTGSVKACDTFSGSV